CPWLSCYSDPGGSLAMTRRISRRWRDAPGGSAVAVLGAVCGVALSLEVARGQETAPDAGEPGVCMPSREPHECAERCPSYDTCYIAEGDGELYYRVMNERFPCDGLDCNAASVELGDYCCRRGDYAPSRGGGGGCAIGAGSASGAPLGG